MHKMLLILSSKFPLHPWLSLYLAWRYSMYFKKRTLAFFPQFFFDKFHYFSDELTFNLCQTFYDFTSPIGGYESRSH